MPSMDVTVKNKHAAVGRWVLGQNVGDGHTAVKVYYDQLCVFRLLHCMADREVARVLPPARTHQRVFCIVMVDGFGGERCGEQ